MIYEISQNGENRKMLPFPKETPSPFVKFEIFRDPAAVKINVSRFSDSITVSLMISLPFGPQGAILGARDPGAGAPGPCQTKS